MEAQAKSQHPMSFRFDEETKKLLQELSKKFVISQAAVIRIAVRKLFDQETTKSV
jgi:hypothetical protein